MKRPLSISLRLTLWLSLAFMIGFLVFGAAMYWQLSYSLTAGRDKTLSGRAWRAAVLLMRCDASAPNTCSARFADFVAATPEGDLIRIYSPSGQLLYPAAASIQETFPWPAPNSIEGTNYRTIRYHGERYRLLVESTNIGSQQIRIVVGGQLHDNGILLRQFLSGLIWAAPLFLIFSGLLGYLLGRRALAPITRLAAAARFITIGNLTRRLPIVNTGDELQDLAETCNELLARLEIAANQISRFTADASHELRSPISYIYTLSESALRNPDLDEESFESFREIVRECSDATRLLEDMLSLARFDAGHTNTPFSQTDLTKILLETCAKAQPFATAKQQEMAIHIAEKTPVWVMGDAADLRRVAWILLDNAVKYTPVRGSVNVILSTTEKTAVFSVTDTGIGISSEDLPEIYRRFYRSERARSMAEGTGLGLAIAKWIADTHRGELSVQSKEGQGTTVQASFRCVE